MKLKFVSIMILLMLIVNIIFPIVMADSTSIIQDFEYSVEGNDASGRKIQITKYKGTSENVEIPSSINNIRVSSVSNNTFSGCKNVKSITIPYTVTNISIINGSDDMFAHEDSLISINVDSNNQYFCSEEGILFNKDKTEIIRYPKGKVNASYTLPTTVSTIGTYAFKSCNNIEEINILRVMDEIGAGAFYDCANLKTVNAPYVETIGKHAFAGCIGLKTISMESVRNIESYAFAGCTSLTNIQTFKNITNIGYRAFSFCSELQNVTVPDTLETLGDLAFAYCTNLQCIKIGKNIATLPKETLKSCTALTTIEVNSDNKNFSSEDGVLYDKRKTKIIKYPSSKENSTYKMPDSITTTDLYAFEDCNNLISVIISDDFKFSSAWNSMFKNCNNLVNIYVNSQNENYSVEEGVLFNKDKTRIIKYLPAKKDESYIIPNTVITIGSYAFYESSNLTDITVSDTATSIEGFAFSGCNNLKKIVIPVSVTNINDYAFYNSNNVTLYCPDNSMAYEFAESNNIQYVLIKDGRPLAKYKVIFKDYDGKILKEEIVVEGRSATSPENPVREGYIFEKWDKEFSNIESDLEVFALYIDAYDLSDSIKTNATLSETTFYYNGCEQFPTITVEYNGNMLVKNQDYTITYKDNTEIGIGKIIIQGTGNYKGTIQKKFIIIPKESQKCGENIGWVINGNTLKISGTGEMYNYNKDNPAPWINEDNLINNKKSDITNLEFSNGITKIGDYAFYGLNGLVTIDFSNTIKEIGKHAFDGCSNINTFTLPEKINYIGESTFANCENIESIEIPDTVTNIGELAFESCKKLNKIKLSKNVEILDKTFKNCTSLTEVNNLSGIKTLSGTFAGCGNLVKVELDEGIKVIEDETFKQCLNLSYVKIPSTIEEINLTAFEKCEDVVLDIYNNSYAVNFAKQNNIKYIENCDNIKIILNKPSIRGEYEYNGLEQIALLDNFDSATMKIKDNTRTDVGKQTVTIELIDKENSQWQDGTTDNVTLDWEIKSKNIENTLITLENKICTYDGIPKMLSVTVKDGSNILNKNIDFTIEFKDNIDIGMAQVIIKGKGNYTGIVTKNFIIYPPQVKNLRATSQTTNAIKYQWNVVSGATGYKVYTYNYSTGKWEYYGKTTNTSMIIKALNPATIYKIKVRAYKNIDGIQHFGPYSIAVRWATAPTQEKITSVASIKGSASLKWRKMENATGYKIYMATSENGTYERIRTLEKNIILYKKLGLELGKTYYFKVRAYKTVDGTQIFGNYSPTVAITVK